MFIDFGKNIWTVLPEERKLDWMTSEALVNSIFTRCSTLTSYNVGLLKPVALTFTLFKIGKNT
ncbi:hypothetical protein KKI91_09205, partial [Xenorhabdus bovienii]|uniref:hypothetical protein n=1 Tax=Xenorhabdus bovienii TaxID=40576 RepID=UPI0023B20959